MKRVWMSLMMFLMAVMLLGCGKQSSTYVVTRNGMDFQVDTQNNTISDMIHTYKYDWSGDASSYRITITYPNGSTYWFSKSGSMGNGGWSPDYDRDAYVDGDTLTEVVLEKAPREMHSGNIFGALLLIMLGIVNAAFPRVTWYLGYGWRYRNAEPSDAALILGRFSGAVAIVFGIIVLFS